MRIVFINMQSNDLLMKTARTILSKSNTPAKYRILLEEMQNNPDVTVCNLITKGGTTLIPEYAGFLKTKIMAFLEYIYILRKNNLNHIKILFSFKQIKKNDIVIGFMHSPASYLYFEKIEGRKFLHVNQFACHHSDSFSKLGKIERFIGEANLTVNEGLFKQLYQNWGIDTMILPFCLGDRFEKKTDFVKRKRKAIATGTLTKFLNDENYEYINYYGTHYLHNMRKAIYESKDFLRNEMDILITPYIEKEIIAHERGENIFRKLYVSARRFNSKGSQKKYFSYNIVEKYNEYCFAVVPEENCGVPAIGCIEAMACGCMYIGIDHPMYRDWGLIAGKHYAGYDGSVEGLQKTICYYQNHLEQAQLIAETGRKYVLEHFTGNAVLKKFLKEIAWRENGAG